jgi:hypothetical protein
MSSCSLREKGGEQSERKRVGNDPGAREREKEGEGEIESKRESEEYPLSACVASSRHLAEILTLACSKDLKISSQLEFF